MCAEGLERRGVWCDGFFKIKSYTIISVNDSKSSLSLSFKLTFFFCFLFLFLHAAPYPQPNQRPDHSHALHTMSKTKSEGGTSPSAPPLGSFVHGSELQAIGLASVFKVPKDERERSKTMRPQVPITSSAFFGNVSVGMFEPPTSLAMAFGLEAASKKGVYFWCGNRAFSVFHFCACMPRWCLRTRASAASYCNGIPTCLYFACVLWPFLSLLSPFTIYVCLCVCVCVIVNVFPKKQR